MPAGNPDRKVYVYVVISSKFLQGGLKTGKVRWPGDSQRESGRFARIDLQKNAYFHNVRAIITNRRHSRCLAPRSAIRKRGVQFGNPEIRKILVSVKFVSAILGPEMGASILWTPGKMRSFLQEKTHVHKIPRFRGGGYFGFWGGGECRFYFYGRADFSFKAHCKTPSKNPS